MSEEKSIQKNVKKRYWACVFYPESLPTDWRDKLQATGLPVAISPLHDKDLNPDGEVKKAHYHIILCYAGPQTFNAVKTLCDEFNQPIPQPLENVKGMWRYHTHMDNPEKVQYSDEDRTYINGFNIMDYMTLTSAEVNILKREIQQFIIENDILEYCDLLDMLLSTEQWERLDVAQNHTLLFNAYIKSRKYKAMESMRTEQSMRIEESMKIDPTTGEVL